ncbi:MAG TPA: DUF2275 domain-containing protein [Spirochaetota bacterium]|nr:DUF2275 domain-containing protein [Spirochaetota bacterium]HPI91124.1 DUF2275 domain-containing protein [Spirochaetota bacterium]HPR49984.1 DUF2275 domain-containing protein [Spirochaetota bacterium]
MKCAEVQKYLPDYLSGELDEKKLKAVEKHLQSCAECAEELNFYRAYTQELRAARPVKAPADFMEKLNRKLERRPSRKSLIELLFLPLRSKLTLEAAGVLAVAFVVFFFWKPYEHKEPVYMPENEIQAMKDVQPQPAEEEKAVNKKAAPSRTRRVAVKRARPADRITAAPESKKESAPAPALSESADLAYAPAKSKKTVFKAIMTLYLEADRDSPLFQPVQERSASGASARDEKQLAEQESAGSPVSKSAPVNREERRWRVDEHMASLVIGHHGTIVRRKLDLSGGSVHSYTVELPAGSLDGFLKDLKRLGPIKSAAVPKGDSIRTYVITIIIQRGKS